MPHEDANAGIWQHLGVFDHVTIRVAGRAVSESFYATVLAELGRSSTYSGPDFAEWEEFSLADSTADKRPTSGLHLGFGAPSREHVDRFWLAGVDAGYVSDGEPGPRPQYVPDYYGAFLIDPDGNSAEAVHHGAVRLKGSLDHLWIRVADVDASGGFYAAAAPYGGYRIGEPLPEYAWFAWAPGSFSVTRGEPTRNVHLAFAVDTNAEVEDFHRQLTEAGYRDNGPPGERTDYHPGYYGAFVLDPDGNNVEAVCHNR